MANNKVQLANGTVLIDITDTTAVASDVAAGKYFYNAAGVKTLGTASGGSAVIVETQDPAGGTVVSIVTDGSIDLTETTATAADVASGKYFFNAAGVKTMGTASGGGGGDPSSIQVYLEQDEDGYLLLTDTTVITSAVGVSF